MYRNCMNLNQKTAHPLQRQSITYDHARGLRIGFILMCNSKRYRLFLSLKLLRAITFNRLGAHFLGLPKSKPPEPR